MQTLVREQPIRYVPHMRHHLFWLCVIALLHVGCGANEAVDAAVGRDAAVSPDAAVPVDAFVPASCDKGQWRDPATGECSACPATPIGCDQLSNIGYDPTSSTFSFDVAGAEVDSVTSNLDVTRASGMTETVDGVVTIEGAHVAADYSAGTAADVAGAGFVRFWLVDACGDASPEIYFTGSWGVTAGRLEGVDFFCHES